MTRLIVGLLIAGLTLVACGDDGSDDFVSARDRYENGSSDGSNVLGSSGSKNSDSRDEESQVSNRNSSSSRSNSSDSKENGSSSSSVKSSSSNGSSSDSKYSSSSSDKNSSSSSSSNIVSSIEDIPDSCEKGDHITTADGIEYVCSNQSKWYVSYSSKKPCTKENEGLDAIDAKGNLIYICRSGYYSNASSYDLDIGYCTSSNKGDTLTYKNVEPLYCTGDQWRKAYPSDYFGLCEQYETTELKLMGASQYVCMDSTWNKLSTLDSTFGLCTRERFGELKIAEMTYVCKYHQWKKATEPDYLGTCNSDNFQEVKPLGLLQYVCRNQIWEEMSLLENRYGLCSKDRLGEVIDSTTNFICKDYDWQKTTKEEVLGECSASNELKTGRWQKELYVCRNSKWSLATSLEDKYGICTFANDGDITEDRIYVCENQKWIETNAEQFYGPCTEALQYTIYKNEYEMCDNGEWRKPQGDESYLRKFCTPDRELMSQYENTIYGRAYYICTQSKWKQVSLVEYTVGLCNADSVGKIGVYSDSTYFCDGTRYRNTNMKSLFGVCTEDKEGIKKTYKDVVYICTAGEWKKEDDLEIEAEQ